MEEGSKGRNTDDRSKKAAQNGSVPKQLKVKKRLGHTVLLRRNEMAREKIEHVDELWLRTHTHLFACVASAPQNAGL